MLSGQQERKQEPLYVLAMAVALVLAAFVGAASGLLWQSAGEDEQEPAGETEDEKEGEGEE